MIVVHCCALQLLLRMLSESHRASCRTLAPEPCLVLLLCLMNACLRMVQYVSAKFKRERERDYNALASQKRVDNTISRQLSFVAGLCQGFRGRCFA